MKKIKDALFAAAGAMELPAGAFSKGARIELTSNREAVIDGCGGILEYGDAVIRVNLGNLTARFCGRNLQIRSLNAREAVITGFITGVDFGS